LRKRTDANQSAKSHSLRRRDRFGPNRIHPFDTPELIQTPKILHLNKTLSSFPGQQIDWGPSSRQFDFFRLVKTDRRVEVPLHSDLKDQLLLPRAQPKTGEFLMPHLAKTAVAGHGGLSEQFFKIMERAGIDRRRVQSSKHRHFSQLSFHALRHSFASNLANAGVPPDLRMRLTGHRSIDVHRRYTHLELAPLVQAIGSLPSLKQNP
jgi:integrase